MSKKIISVMLALVLVLSTLATVAFAAGVTFEELDAEGLSTNTQTWSLGEPRDNGNGTYSVDVSLTTNYPTGAIQFLVEETDPDNAITLTGVTVGSAITYDAEASKNSSGLVVIVPQTTAETSLITAPVINGVVATLTYTYAGSGSAQIAIKNDPYTEGNTAGTLLAARMGNGNIVGTDFIAGQTVLSTGEARTIGAAGKPELVVKAGTNGAINETYKCVYGIDVMDAGQTLSDVFEVTNGGSFVVKANGEGMEEGTGAVITVYSGPGGTGSVVGEYTVVIHGDVNGDGSADSLDASILCEYEIGFIPDFSAYGISDDIAFIAGDVNADGGADSLDASIICEFEIGFLANIYDITTLPGMLSSIWA